MVTLPRLASAAVDALRVLADARHVALRYARPEASVLVIGARGVAVCALLELHAAVTLHAHRARIMTAWWPQMGDVRLSPDRAAILIRDGATDRGHEEAYALGLNRWAGDVAEILRAA